MALSTAAVHNYSAQSKTCPYTYISTDPVGSLIAGSLVSELHFEGNEREIQRKIWEITLEMLILALRLHFLNHENSKGSVVN